MCDDGFTNKYYSWPNINSDNCDEFVYHGESDYGLYEHLYEDDSVEQNSFNVSYSEEQHADQDLSNGEAAEESHNEDDHDENHSDDSGEKESIVDTGNDAKILEETAINHSKDLKHFTCFGQLPPELRVKIWTCTFPENRIISLVSHNNRNIVPTQPPASVFHICRESRKEAQKSFKWKFNTYVSRSEEIFFFEKIPGLRALVNLWKRHRDIGVGERIDHAVIEWDVLAVLLYKEFDEELKGLVMDILPESRFVTVLIDPYIIRKGEVSLGDTCEPYPESVRNFVDMVEETTNAWSDTPALSPMMDSPQEFSNDELGNPDFQKRSIKIETKIIKRDGKSWPAIEVDSGYAHVDNYLERLQCELWEGSLNNWMWPRNLERLY